MSLVARKTRRARAIRATGFQRKFARFADFVALTKPRVMSLVVFTALVGLSLAPEPSDACRSVMVLACIAAGAGGAAALNMWYDADVDALMGRTAKRPIPSGRVSRTEGLIFGLALSICATVALGLIANIATAGLLAFTIFFYVFVYTIWLKRRTPQNIVIGGAAGALPPVIGWIAGGGHVGIEPLLLFLIIFLWTPPHFWALSLNHADEYARAGIPMLPVMAGCAETKKQILIYSVLLAPIAVTPWILGIAGALYGVTTTVAAAAMVALAAQLYRTGRDTQASAAGRLFGFSIVYLFLQFALLFVDAAANHGQPS
jgi:protoheme IX farnesyltransferase